MSIQTRHRSPIDILTTAAVALVVYTSSSILHEALGHGLTCVLLGGRVACIASTVCLGSGKAHAPWAARMVAAGGSLMNLAAAAVSWGLLRTLKTASPSLRYFLWLSFAVNGFMGAGYLAVPTLIGFGDWMNFLRGLEPYWAWRVAIIGLGVILYGTVAAVAVQELQPFLSLERSERLNRALKLTLVSYVTGGLAFCAAGFFNPVGMKLVLISAAAASFGGASGLVWLGFWAAGAAPGDPLPEPPLSLTRSWLWIVSGGLSAALLIGVLGPGVKFGAR